MLPRGSGYNADGAIAWCGSSRRRTMIPEPVSPSDHLPSSQPDRYELLGEFESDGGWEYDARIIDRRGASSQIRLRLPWSEYHLWVPAGDLPPATVAEAVLRFVASHRDAFAGLERIDAGSLRRRVADADAAIAVLLRTSG